MQLDQALTHVAVLGAAGKMGCGIALLLLQEMTRLKTQKNDEHPYTLNLIDLSEEALAHLRIYLREHILKYAEKNINLLRIYQKNNPHLVSNEEIIESFVNQALDIVNYEISLSGAKDASLIFEAIVEDVEVKTKVFRTIVEMGNKEGFFLTNTSSIPIQLLNEQANLNNRIVGFHFYNPPAVQKLLEIVIPPSTNSHLKKISEDLAIRLKKTMIYSNDIAGFIGNGHMIREIVFACQKVEELSKQYSLPEAIYIVNRVTQDWLIRPMGIFQLIDYVGIDVCDHICEVMSRYLNDSTLKVPLLQMMLEKGVAGGQNPDGSQKNGFFMYAKHTLMGIYSLPAEKYISFTDAYWITSADRLLGEIPAGHLSWKQIQKEKDSSRLLKKYFEHLSQQATLGSQLAQSFLQESRDIAQQLVKDGVANSIADVDIVLMNGFFHSYGTNISFEEANV